jgi:hypothetical protein
MLEFEKELKTRRLREIDQIEKSVEVDLYNNQQKRLEELEEFENKIHSLSIIEKAYELGQVDKDVLNKARSGVYKDTPYNRKHGRVGVRFGKKVEGGDTKGLDDDGKEKKTENEKVNMYFDKFKQKMGKNTSMQTAMGWVEGARMNKKNEKILKDKIKSYLLK